MLDKAIKFGKEKRKPYYGEKAIDKTCRNNGDDPWSFGNRTFFDKKARSRAYQHVKDFIDNSDLMQMPKIR